MKRLVLGFFINSLLVSAVFGSSLEDALNTERLGDLEAARTAYIIWLGENSRARGAGDVLLHASALGGEPVNTLSLLKRFVDDLSSEEAYPVYARIAALEEMLGLLAPAAINYRRASKAAGDQGEIWLLNALGIEFSMGEFNRVKSQALSLSETGQTVYIRDEALALAAASQAKLSDVNGALERIMKRAESAAESPIASPLFWLTMLEIAESGERSDLMRQASRELQNSFPSSAGTYLSQSRILYWESPGRLFGLSRTEKRFPLQVGVFRNRDGASSFRTQLETDGFTAWLEEDGDLWRVLVHDGDGGTADRLAKKGYEALIRR